jgi:serine/threonine protein kinase
VEALNDRYDIVDTVSRSGRVELLKAWDRDHDRFVALKVISPDKTMTREQIVGEARVLLRLTPHRGLATVRYDFSAGNRYVIVMDWIDGTDLEAYATGTKPIPDPASLPPNGKVKPLGEPVSEGARASAAAGSQPPTPPMPSLD